MEPEQHKMKIEVWSDIMCPFCYIGKRKLEAALNAFPQRNKVEVVWKSFQLAPDIESNTGKNIHQYLAEHKGMSLEDAKRMNDYVTQLAAKEGLEYNFDKAIVANSFNAHRLLHFAQHNGKQNEVKEKLMNAYFTEGKNTDDTAALVQIGKEAGLDETAVKTALDGNQYADEVNADMDEAQQIGVRGVPFFVFDRKYAISGAQDARVFTQTLEKSFAEWREMHPAFKMEVSGGPVCTPDGECK